jgi:Protein of unknown function (DUF3486)
VARFTSIARLPVDVRTRIADRRRAGSTIRELVDDLAAMGLPVSKSAIGRWVRHFDAEEVTLAPAVLELRGIRLALAAILEYLNGRQTTI